MSLEVPAYLPVFYCLSWRCTFAPQISFQVLFFENLIKLDVLAFFCLQINCQAQVPNPLSQQGEQGPEVIQEKVINNLQILGVGVAN